MPRAFGGGGCAFLVVDGEQCGAPRKLASSYCPPHHALCYLANGSRAERERLRLIGVIGDSVGRQLALGKFSNVFVRRPEGRQP
jgi:hypothetical protein